jgi:hypothetical protein
MKFAFTIFSGFALALVILAGTSYVMVQAQTKADAQAQLKNLSPIASVERWTCVDNASAPVNCDGLSMIRLTLTDGTVIGPFVGITASQTIRNDGKWTQVPLASATPPVPSQSLSKAK